MTPHRQALIQFQFQPKPREFIKGFDALKPPSTRSIGFMATIEAPELNQKLQIEVREVPYLDDRVQPQISHFLTVGVGLPAGRLSVGAIHIQP